ncbi:hypothetical protein DW082_13175 [Alistipes sp. AF48-12]|nr:hypothetical protein DW082_13175 [Alistipes sp. AF48-12]
MWFKAYLTDAVSHKPDTLPAGEYTLRAYTGWMLNFEPAFFFRRNINVGNTRSDRIRTDVTYTSAQAIVRFADADGRPIRDAEADYELFDWNGKRIEGVRQRTSATGALFVDLPHDSIRNGGYIRMKLDEGGTAFRRTLFLEPEAHDFAVQFFPEGGELVAGVPRLVAFKAERADGYPEDVRGSVLDSRGDTVVSFVAEHDGMGTFLLCPLQGETYRAVCRGGGTGDTGNAAGSRRRSLRADNGTGARTHPVQGRRNGAPGEPSDRAYPGGLLLHRAGRYPKTRGNHTDGLPARRDTPPAAGGQYGTAAQRKARFPEKNRKTGAVDGNPEKPQYGKREKVRVEIGLKDDGGKPIEADLSVSVTDRRAVRYDFLGN